MNTWNMKVKISASLIAALMIVGTLSLSAQNRIIRNQGFYYTIEGFAGYGLPVKTDYYIDQNFSPFNLGVKTSANIFLDYHFSVGAGLGLTQYKSPDMRTLPVTLNMKYFAGKPARTPFVYVEGGYAMRTDADKQYKGPVYEAGFGYRHQLQNRYNFLMFKIGYSGFKAKHWLWAPKEGTTWQDKQPQWYYLSRSTINFTIAFYHSTRY